LGGWRIGAIQVYSSGYPIGVIRNAPLPIQNGINRPFVTSYDWKASWTGDFDPNVDRFLSAAAFPTQPAGVLGNATRYNPLVRAFPNLIENVSLGKSFVFTERWRLDFRAEAFNLLNRVVFSAPTSNGLNLTNAAFGSVTAQSNNPRQMQLGLK